MKFLLLLFLLLNVSAIENNKQPIASYDTGQNLMLLSNSYDSWYVHLMLEKQGVFEDSYESPIPYCATYWDETNNTYYYVYGLIKTNGLTYTLDINLQYEPIIDSRFREIMTTEDWKKETTSVDETNRIPNGLLYIGNISSNKRAYIDLYNTNIQYIKELHLVSNIYTDGSMNSLLIPLDSPVYPFVEKDQLSFYYTNQQGQKFRRSWERFTLIKDRK